MKKMALVLALTGWMWVGGVWQQTAYASQFSDGLGKTWSFLFSPVNAVTQLGGDLITCITTSTVHFVQTVISNANPNRLIP